MMRLNVPSRCIVEELGKVTIVEGWYKGKVGIGVLVRMQTVGVKKLASDADEGGILDRLELSFASKTQCRRSSHPDQRGG